MGLSQSDLYDSGYKTYRLSEVFRYIDATGEVFKHPSSHEITFLGDPKYGHEWLRREKGRKWLNTTYGYHWLETPNGQVWLNGPNGHEWLDPNVFFTECIIKNGVVSCRWIKIADDTFMDNATQNDIISHKWLETPNGNLSLIHI